MIHSLITHLKEYAQRHTFVFPIVLLFITLLCYGPMGVFAGFHWDDWLAVLNSNIHLPNVFWNAYADRPFSSWTFTVMFPILGNSGAAWQIANMILRWAGVYLTYLVLVDFFPRQRSLLRWAALISLILPVFQYQYISVAFSQHFLTYLIFAASLYFLILSIKQPRYFWLFYSLSLLFAAAHMFMMEYFVGLEILRPFVLYFSLKKYSGSKTHIFRKALLFYLPFLVALSGFLYWRFYYYPHFYNLSTDFSNSPLLINQLLAHPIDTVKTLLTTVIADLRFTFFSSWLDRLWPTDLYLESKTMWLALFIGAVACAVFLLFFGEKKENAPDLTNREFWKDLLLGLVIFLFGIAPVWVTLRQVSAGKFSERFALAAIPGIALIFVALFWKVIGSVRVRTILLSAIVILSISYQVQMGSDMKKDYAGEQDIFSQLKWRMPQLKPGTGIYSPNIFTGYEADDSYGMSLNLDYGSTVQPELNYWFFTPRDYPVIDLLNDPNQPVKGGTKGTTYNSTAADMVAVYQNSTGCLLVLDPIYAQLTTTITNFTDYGSLTNFNLISDYGSAGTSFAQAFGKISTNDWCYYFEKADLAKQEKNWDQVISLYQEASQKGFQPIKSVEYIPLITALAEKGQVTQALDVTNTAINLSDMVIPPACKLWSTLMQENPQITQMQVTGALGEKVCTFQSSN